MTTSRNFNREVASKAHMKWKRGDGRKNKFVAPSEVQDVISKAQKPEGAGAEIGHPRAQGGGSENDGQGAEARVRKVRPRLCERPRGSGR